jgi:putative membrane-bound dehydrogenase-like protein
LLITVSQTGFLSTLFFAKQMKIMTTIRLKLICQLSILFLSFSVIVFSCKSEKTAEAAVDLGIERIDSARTVAMAAGVESLVKPQLAEGLTLKLWGIDSLVISPIAIDIDDLGRLYYTTTNRQKNSEFDIRGHRDWEIESIQLQTIEDKRAFLRRILSPENSDKNKWLTDLNGDSSHDWRDMTIEKDMVYRLEDKNGDGVADFSQLMVNDFNDEVTDVAGGVLSDGDDLYVAIGPDMWRLKDKNGDGVADEKTSISTGYGIHIGFSGHGMSGTEMGPDGKVYWQIGDIGFNGTDKDGKKWEHPNSGVVVRSNPDGSDFEVFAAGLRNTHEFVFDEYGNIISEDNDGDHDGERERLVYIVNGSDAGWRSNWQYGKYRDKDNNTYKVWMDEKLYLPRFEGQAAYIVPPIANYVSGPTGMVYNPGTALGPEYKNSFFLAEFVGNPSGSGIHNFRLKPKGAGFELGETKKIISGILPTGLDFGPDGALYIADWIDGWGTSDFGRIWKMDVKDGAASAERQQTKMLLAADFKTKKVDELGELLKHADMRVRQKSQFELVKRGEEGAKIFEQYLKQTTHQLSRVHSIWGITQLARQQKKYASLIVPYLKDSDPEIRAQAAKWLGDIKYADAVAQLIPLLKDEYSRARFFAAEALGRIAYEPAINPIIDMLKENNDADVYLRHAGSLALSRIGKADPVIALSSNSSRALRIAAILALRRMSHPGIAVFLNDKDEYVVTEAARAINDDLSIEKALPALGNVLQQTGFKDEALLRRAISANLRVGTPEAMQNLLNYSTKETAPAVMRAEAIEALGTWAKPSVLDRVDGRYRAAITRDIAPVKSAAALPLLGLLKTKDVPVRLAVVKALAKLGVADASTQLHVLLKSDASPEVRVAALESLVKLKDNDVAKAISLAIADKSKIVRVAGLDILDQLDIAPTLMVSLLNDVIATKTMEEKQAAILTLGKISTQHSGQSFADLLSKMEAGKLSPDVYLELGEAIDSTKSADLIARYKKISSSFSPDQVLASYTSSLSGGDPRRGAEVFFWNQNSQCIRCHAYDDRGGNAGPQLNNIGSKLTREQILEALVNPSARISPGFGIVTLELKNGEKLSGILQEETNTVLKLKVGDEPQKQIAKDQVVKRENAMSSMPDMKVLLSRKEIRDVVSFLAASKKK